jgi:hypothetical protein
MATSQNVVCAPGVVRGGEAHLCRSAQRKARRSKGSARRRVRPGERLCPDLVQRSIVVHRAQEYGTVYEVGEAGAGSLEHRRDVCEGAAGLVLDATSALVGWRGRHVGADGAGHIHEPVGDYGMTIERRLWPAGHFHCGERQRR